MARRSKLRPQRSRPALTRRLIAIKQRFLRRYRARLHRVKQEGRPFTRALRRLSTTTGLCAVFTISYALTSWILGLLLWTRLEEVVFAAWSSFMHLGCLVYSIWVELRPNVKEHVTVKDMLQRRTLVTYTLQHELARLSVPADSDASSDPHITIFVAGTSIRTVALRVQLHWTVSQVVATLRHRRAIAPLEQVRQYLVFPPYSPAPLHPDERLQDIGMQDLSTLHVRTCVAGGAARGRVNDSEIVSFSGRTGCFKAKHAKDFQALGGRWRGYFKCLLCDDVDPIHRYYVQKHEDSKTHQRHRKWRVAQEQSSSASSSACPAGTSASVRPPSPFVPPHFDVDFSSESTGCSFMDVDDEAANGFIPDLDVRSPLLEIFDQLQASSGIESSQGQATTDAPDIEVDWARVTGGLRLQPSTEETALARISSALRAYLLDSVDVGCESDDEEEFGDEGEEDEQDEDAQDQSAGTQSREDSVDQQAGQSRSDIGQPSRPSRTVSDVDNPCFPWPDRETLILDILRHIPRCAFSEKQNTVIHWALLAMGISDIPTEHTMERVTRALQRLYGVASIRYKGAMGHIYFVNDMAALIAQELANPQVRKHLRFLPEDAGRRLSEAWQGSRWLRELDPDLATPMVRIHDQDFYVLEPAQLRDGRICMPVRFFTRGKDTMAYGWAMVPTADKSGWVIAQDSPIEGRTCDFLTSFPVLGRHTIITIYPIHAESLLANGHRVFAFPIWLFCDDTSGNVSKKWNKHNSFLFTAAGLPRRLVHREYNVHFLATSNAALPLEMLDGIADQLLACQTSGVWAWDCELQEMVLLIPSVLAILGDNPMQSEIACHVGMNGKMFCRMCMVSKGQDDEDDEDDETTAAGMYRGRRNRAGSVAGSDSEASVSGVALSPRRHQQRKRPKESETMAEMIERIKRFMKINPPRTRQETINILKSQFVQARRVGGQAEYKRVRTETGVRDAYQLHFAERLFRITTRRGVARLAKEAEVEKTVRTIPHADEGATSPVWRIKDFDPHLDTPVEILHVILLGFVKYFWRDAMSRLKDAEKEKLIVRLNSFDVAGLGFPPLAGATLVNYAGSLVGRDFRALAQVAPFILHDFASIPQESIEAWTALSYIIPLVWQPEIDDIDAYTVSTT
ncbi:hypothetical protein BN946_scf184833.g15 [Trametes cinnabarina]|uniref:Ubiquitin-like domain-containing protein n=1 Tax=Pycnoporus cinnabarinus TaxID=5643 RepID=A0A060SUI8_PYCCI|nr:hypothetical protein BN946_scf184833.g15 [Trametes cinnabarina]